MKRVLKHFVGTHFQYLPYRWALKFLFSQRKRLFRASAIGVKRWSIALGVHNRITVHTSAKQWHILSYYLSSLIHQDPFILMDVYWFNICDLTNRTLSITNSTLLFTIQSAQNWGRGLYVIRILQTHRWNFYTFGRHFGLEWLHCDSTNQPQSGSLVTCISAI